MTAPDIARWRPYAGDAVPVPGFRCYRELAPWPEYATPRRLYAYVWRAEPDAFNAPWVAFRPWKASAEWIGADGRGEEAELGRYATKAAAQQAAVGALTALDGDGRRVPHA